LSGRNRIQLFRGYDVPKNIGRRSEPLALFGEEIPDSLREVRFSRFFSAAQKMRIPILHHRNFGEHPALQAGNRLSGTKTPARNTGIL
jgi:hypothetical protein